MNKNILPIIVLSAVPVIFIMTSIYEFVLKNSRAGFGFFNAFMWSVFAITLFYQLLKLQEEKENEPAK